MRLDCYLAESKKARTRSEAANLIKMGAVYVNGMLAKKTSMPIDISCPPEISVVRENYASIGAYKLKTALDYWQINVQDKVVLDAGASTGGFTSVLLSKGAKKVYAVDVGEGLLRAELQQDARVIAIEKTNVRFLSLEQIPERCDIITVDLSFISLKLVLTQLKQFLDKKGILIALIKPQFELDKKALNKQGVVKNETLALSAINSIKEYATSIGFMVLGAIPTPHNFAKKNREYLILLSLSAKL